eukprot:7391338-Prymnesium_polylepis.2
MAHTHTRTVNASRRDTHTWTTLRVRAPVAAGCVRKIVLDRQANDEDIYLDPHGRPMEVHNLPVVPGKDENLSEFGCSVAVKVYLRFQVRRDAPRRHAGPPRT